MHARNKARARAEREANKASLRERESQGRRWAAEAAQALAADAERALAVRQVEEELAATAAGSGRARMVDSAALEDFLDST